MDSIGTYHVIDEVTNQGNNTATFTKVSGVFYNINRQVIGEGSTGITPNNLPAGQTAPFEIVVHSQPGQQIAYTSYNVQSQEYTMINNIQSSVSPKSLSPSSSSSSYSPRSEKLLANSTTPITIQAGTQSSRTINATTIETLKEIPSTRDSFKNDNNNTIQVISATVDRLPGGIALSMTGQLKNTGKDILRFLTITAQILDSKYKVIGIVIGMARNNNLAPGQLTSFSGFGNIPHTLHPIFFKLTFDWL